MYTKDNFYEMDKTDLRAVNGGAGDRFLVLGDLIGVIIGPQPPRVVPVYGIPVPIPLYGIPGPTKPKVRK